MPKRRSGKKPIRKVYLLGDKRKGAIRKTLRVIEPFLEEHVEIVGIDLTAKKSLKKVRADLVIVLGGDGSMLGAARSMGPRPIPTVGVNLGRLGFLTSLTPDSVISGLEKILAGRYQIEDRMMVECWVWRGKKKLFHTLSLNDVVMARRSRSKMITAAVSIGRKDIIDYRCDGIIVATPTGATGYSLSAGGPMLDPSLEATVITPICPHTMSNRPLVVPAKSPLRIRLTDVVGTGSVIVDGQEWLAIRGTDVIEIKRAKQSFPLVVPHGLDFYSSARSRLGWHGKMEPISVKKK